MCAEGVIPFLSCGCCSGICRGCVFALQKFLTDKSHKLSLQSRLTAFAETGSAVTQGIFAVVQKFVIFVCMGSQIIPGIGGSARIRRQGPKAAFYDGIRVKLSLPDGLVITALELHQAGFLAVDGIIDYGFREFPADIFYKVRAFPGAPELCPAIAVFVPYKADGNGKMAALYVL